MTSVASSDHTVAGRRARAGELVARAAARAHLGVLAVAALAPVVWFRDGLATKGVDSFFSLHPEGRTLSSLYGWDARTSAGAPAFDLIALPLNAVQGVLAAAGVPLALLQWLVLTTLAAASVFGMYTLARLVLRVDSDSVAGNLACAFASVAWVANPFALAFVWWHQLLIEFTWAVLPWMLVLLVAAVRGSRPAPRVLALLVLLVVIGAAAFPHAYLPGIALLCGLVALGLIGAERRRLPAVARALAFAVVFVLALAWWLVPSIEVVGALYTQASVGGSSLEQLRYASLFSSLPNVVTLTALPHLYGTVNGVPYVTWAGLVTSPAGMVLRFVLPCVALVGLGAALRSRGYRGVGAALAVSVGAAAFVSKGLNAPFPGINLALSELSFGGAFRHPVDKLSFALVLPLCLLFAFGLRALFSWRPTREIGFCCALVVTAVIGLPWWTGDAIPRGGKQLPSAWVEVPTSYERVGAALAAAPRGGKTFALPYSADGGAAFRWKHGIQANLDPLLQDWAPARSVLARSSGDPLADRPGSGLADATRRADPRVFALARLWGVDRWLVHRDWASDYFPQPVSPEEATLFLANPAGVEPAITLARTGQFVDLPHGIRSLHFYASVERTPLSEDRVLELGSFVLQVNREGYFALRDVEHRVWAPALPPPKPGRWHLIGLRFDPGTISLSIDGVAKTARVPLRGAVPSYVQVLSPCVACGSIQMTPFALSTRPDAGAPRVSDVDGGPGRLLSTPELELWQQDALPLVYAARSASLVLEPYSLRRMLSAAEAAWDEPAPVLLPSDVDPWYQPDPRSSTSFRQLDPTRLEGSLRMRGTTVLVFSQTFDRRWRLSVDGTRVDPASHVRVNGFANGWVVYGSGTHRWKLSYAPQRRIELGLLAGAGLLTLALLTLATPVVRVRCWRRRDPAVSSY